MFARSLPTRNTNIQSRIAGCFVLSLCVCARVSHAPAFSARTPIKQCRILLCVLASAIANACAFAVAATAVAAYDDDDVNNNAI